MEQSAGKVRIRWQNTAAARVLSRWPVHVVERRAHYMTYRYEWRLRIFRARGLPPFNFALSSDDDGAEPHTSLSLAYPEHLERWAPLYKWPLAIPQYFVLAALFVLGFLGILAGFFAVLFTGAYPESIWGLLVSAHRYSLRGEAYVGFLTVRYPPFILAA